MEPEDEVVRKQDEHHLRELRICVREVRLGRCARTDALEERRPGRPFSSSQPGLVLRALL